MEAVILLWCVLFVCGIYNKVKGKQHKNNGYSWHQRQHDEFVRWSDESARWSMEEGRKSLTPFEHGGYNMSQGNSFNNHNNGTF